MLICHDCESRFGSWAGFQRHELKGPCGSMLVDRFLPPMGLLLGVPVDAETIARVIHEANRALQHALNDPAPSPAYDDAPSWQLTGLHAGVQAALDGADPEALHELWLAAKRADGWTYGRDKDPVSRTHPCLVPYDELPAEQRAKDDLFAAIVSALR